MIQPSQRTAIHHSGVPRMPMEATSITMAHGTTVTSIHTMCKVERAKCIMGVRSAPERTQASGG